MCCWCQTDLNWWGRKSNSNDHSLQGVQKSISKPVEPSSKWATVAGDHFCHLRTGNWCYNLHAVTKNWQLRVAKSPFVLRHLAGVWMWREEYKSMDPANTEQENERTLIYCLPRIVWLGGACSWLGRTARWGWNEVRKALHPRMQSRA